MEILTPLITLGFITKNNKNTIPEENKFKQLYIDNFQISAFDNLMYDNYKKKLYLKVSNNYFESIKPNTTMINKEWRYENGGYKKAINDMIKTKLNEDLMSLENFENVNNTKNSNNYIFFICAFIILLIFIAIYLKKK
jgi:hypothetical protein